ncbi:uncharacterized protein LOC124137493 [Haliotis rufescens]|uniref:uncharacterized protein LOC124137493 n=1 Tax=Haliotis rufescens TaxID=6454 RepID=UPI001EB09410|nr:uncharacterized protein LOC124137493 [Haliotis rufescens]XP_046359779.1 uncharacterized protein LOC124137493 [Haliotis rufescens]
MAIDMGFNETLQQETKLEAYSVVLSVTTLLLAAIGGGAGSLTVICAILEGKSIHKLSYSIILVLLFACLVLDLLWTPQEILHLLYYHYTYQNPTQYFKIFVHGMYLLLSIVMAVAIVFVSAENIFRQCSHMGKMFQKIWSITGSITAVLVGLCMAGSYLVISTQNETNVPEYFVVFNSRSFCMKVVILGIFTFLVLAIMLCVIFSAIIHKKHSGGFHGNSNSGCKHQVPTLLIRDPEGNPSEDESEDTPSVHAASPLPLLAINAAGGPSRDGPMPISPKNKNMLGVNMTQILGRRRHTICQIGDSSTNFMDPAEKAKKYTYVRKFSVDISALQAQLENPKLFSGKAPFQSDTDLQSKSRNNSQKGRLPLKTPVLKFDEKDEKVESEEVKNDVRPMLPLITVSDDEGTEKEEVDAKSEHESVEEGSEKDKTTLTFKLPNMSEECHGSDHESLHSFDNDSTTDLTLSFTKLSCLLSVTFCLCTLPLFLTEVLRNHLSTIAYINITTCTLALSTIQTIIYPQVIICMDSVVHRAVHKLWIRFLRRCRCTAASIDEDGEENRTNLNTDTSQV